MSKDRKEGRIIIEFGSMYSGKSEILQSRLRSSQRAHKSVLAVKPVIDSRYSKHEIVSKRKKNDPEGSFEPSMSFPATPVNSTEEILGLVSEGKYEVVGIDEAQFFDERIVKVVEILAFDLGVDVFIAGLDLDAWRKPFGSMLQLIAMSNEAHKHNANCFKCGSERGGFTQKIAGSEQQIEVGGEKLYEARCSKCWTPPPVA